MSGVQQQLHDAAIPAPTIIAQSERRLSWRGAAEGAQWPSIKSSSHKMVLTQAKKGDGSCGFCGAREVCPLIEPLTQSKCSPSPAAAIAIRPRGQHKHTRTPLPTEVILSLQGQQRNKAKS